MNKNIDVDALDGILVDHAWLFEPYMMNREAQFLEKKLFLEDGAHWAGQKKMEKSDQSGKGLHLGYVFFID